MARAHAVSFALALVLGVLATPAGADPKSDAACSPSGRRIAPGACLEIEGKVAPDELTLERNDALPEEKLRDYCPNLVAVRPDGTRTRLELDKSSFLYDTSDCCPGTEIKLDVDSRRRRFTLSGLGRDCFGGTARFEMKESYRLEKAGKAVLTRRTNKVPQGPSCPGQAHACPVPQRPRSDGFQGVRSPRWPFRNDRSG